MDDLSRFCCQNPGCSEAGKRGAGNLTVCGRYGKHETIRLLYCRKCRARFSERKGTALFNSRLPSVKAMSVLEHIAEGCGIRKTGRLVSVNRGSVGRLANLAGDQSRALHDELVAFSPSHA
jgi:transposase-like protein